MGEVRLHRVIAYNSGGYRAGRHGKPVVVRQKSQCSELLEA